MADDWDRKKNSIACVPRMRNVFFFSLRKTVTNVFTMLIGLLISLLPFFLFFLSFNLSRRMLCTFFFFLF